MIEINGVSKRYGELSVYNHFDLRLQEGDITCILGESGCGKTTLLNMLAGLTDFDGKITPRLRCSYIFQQPRLVPSLTVSGNLRLVSKDAAAVRRMLGAVELLDKADAYPAELSGGQAQRVSIARAFLFPSDLILMDEPFSSLDTALKIRLADVFIRLWRAEKRTAVFVTHNVEEAYMLAHRAVVLKAGKIAADIVAGEGLPRPYGRESAFKEQILEALLRADAEIPE